MSLTLTPKILRPYLRPVFVETGTFEGGGIDVALAANAHRVISIEVHEPYWRKQSNRFSGNPKVEILLGDSGKILLPAIENVQESITFWLDGHAHLDGAGEKKSPILEELEQISRHHRNDHIILIDDYGVMGTELWDHVNETQVRTALLKINPTYQINVIPNKEDVNGILVAVPA